MATLVVFSGPAQSGQAGGEGSHLPLTLPLVSIGREDTCTFQVLDPMVSRTHLQVRFDEQLGKHVAGDYRSAHGTMINGKTIVFDTPLNDGDRITIGGTTLVYLAADCADGPSALAAAKKKDEWKRSTIMRSE